MISVCVPGGQIRRQNARHPRGGERHIRHDACRDVFSEDTELVKYLERGSVDLRPVRGLKPYLDVCRRRGRLCGAALIFDDDLRRFEFCTERFFELAVARADASTRTTITDERRFVFMALSASKLRVVGTVPAPQPRLLMGKAARDDANRINFYLAMTMVGERTAIEERPAGEGESAGRAHATTQRRGASAVFRRLTSPVAAFRQRVRSCP